MTYHIADRQLTFIAIGDVEFNTGKRVLLEGLTAYAENTPMKPRVLFDLEQSTENRSATDL